MIARRSLLAGALAAPLSAWCRTPPGPAVDSIIDSHMHIASPDTVRFPPAPIDGLFHPHMLVDANTAERFAALMAANGVERACAVQRAHLYGYDNRYILDAAERFPRQLSAVMVVDAADPATPAMLRTLFAGGRSGSIRLMGKGDAHAIGVDWLNAPATGQTWRVAAELGLPVVVEVLKPEMPVALPAIAVLALRYPSVSIVIDHAGLILPIPSGLTEAQARAAFAPPTYGWPAAFRQVVDRPNVHVKFTQTNFLHLGGSADAARLFVRRLVALVGAERAMWGSDFPQTKGAYADMVALARASVAELPAQTRRRLLHDNARRLFFGR